MDELQAELERVERTLQDTVKAEEVARAALSSTLDEQAANVAGIHADYAKRLAAMDELQAELERKQINLRDAISGRSKAEQSLSEAQTVIQVHAAKIEALQTQIVVDMAELHQKYTDQLSTLGSAKSELESQVADEHMLRRKAETQLAQVQDHLQATQQRRSVRWADGLRGMLNGRAHIRQSWSLMNGAARTCYRAGMAIAPGPTRALRGIFEPLLHKGNRLVFGTTFVPLEAHMDAGPDAEIFQFDFQQPRAYSADCTTISIIVPNYNHAAYLEERLESIYAQNYPHYEVILMDDCSSDNSCEILQRYASKYPDRTRLLLNTENSGGVFYQWKKGIKAARGDLIWIAESDDWCSPNMLETLVPFFQNAAVQMAYAKTVFMNGDGSEQIWSMENYLDDLGPEKWQSPFVETCADLFRRTFSSKNIIPNTSSAVFRKPSDIDVLMPDDWVQMKTCGDWYFYLHMLRGGMLAYSPDAENYYRMHQENTSVSNYSQASFYREHERIAQAINRYCKPDAGIWISQKERLVDHWKSNSASYSDAAFRQSYSLERIQKDAEECWPNVLMVGYGFCAGGGETFPIQLANVLRDAGFTVTFLDCAQEQEIPEIRASLHSEIPVVSNFADLNRIVEHFDIDIIHSHHAWVDNTVLDLLASDSRARTVVSLHGMYETIEPHALKLMLPRLVERTGRLVYTAEKNLSALLDSGLVKKEDIPRIDNALSVYDYPSVDRARLGIPGDAFVFCLVARAFEFKGWAEAIEAVSRARDFSGKDIHLVLIGDGPVYDQLKRDGHSDFTHLMGFQSNVRGYFEAADMGLLPSKFKGESFPLVLIDCLLAGRPVLATNVGEIEYMLNGSSGFAGDLVALNDWNIPIDELAQKMARAASDRDYYQTMMSAIAPAMEKFDLELMQQRYATVYCQLVKARDGNE